MVPPTRPLGDPAGRSSSVFYSSVSWWQSPSRLRWCQVCFRSAIDSATMAVESLLESSSLEAIALAVGRIPGLNIDRAGIALVGMVASGALPLEPACRAIDLDTITLLLGVMIVVANLRLSGFFAIAT